jgi:N-acyl-D-aspartate/D-glutamate deacylase
MRQPDRIFISDAWEIGRGMPHPGAYGAYPHILRRYVREERVLTLEEAIRRMTVLPARRLGLSERGILREGAWADLVIFDFETIRDRSTHEAPRQTPEGIHYVLINGEPVVEAGCYNGKFVGQVLRNAA